MRLNSPSTHNPMNTGQTFTWQAVLRFLADGDFAQAYDEVAHLNNDILQSETNPPEGYDEVLAALAIWKAVNDRYAATAA